MKPQRETIRGTIVYLALDLSVHAVKVSRSEPPPLHARTGSFYFLERITMSEVE